jgi:hypothetical protein
VAGGCRTWLVVVGRGWWLLSIWRTGSIWLLASLFLSFVHVACPVVLVLTLHIVFLDVGSKCPQALDLTSQGLYRGVFNPGRSVQCHI